MAAVWLISKRVSTNVIQLGGRNSSRLLAPQSKSGYLLYRSLIVGPRKLTFGKKTDLEVLIKHMKLGRHEKFAGAIPSTFCAELLANRCEDMDYKMVRERQPFFLNYRLDLLKQRVRFMESMKVTPRQKRRNVERNPPVLMVSYADGGFSVCYLRGLIRCGETKYVHFLYRCYPKLRSYVFEIDSKLSSICKELGITSEGALRMAIHMPCFLLWNVDKATEEFRVIHRDSGLPLGYNIDYHTAPIYPPILQSSIRLNHGLLTNNVNPQLLDKLELFSMADILEYRFAGPRGRPEDLSSFLLENSRAEGANENAELLSNLNA